MKQIAIMLTVILLAGWSGSARADGSLYTNVYVVPPEFQTSELPAPEPDDVKSAETAETAEGKEVRLSGRTAIDILRSAGVSFPAGASAIYNRKTSQLIVRNTEDQMKLVEAYIDWVRKQ